MQHHTTENFWRRYNALPQGIRNLADKNFELLKANPAHPSLQLKTVQGRVSARIGINYRVLGIERDETITWVWIGPHAEYDRILTGR